MTRWPLFSFCMGLIALASWMVPIATAETLAERDAGLLKRYLATLAAGAPGDAAMVDRLAEMPFGDMQQVIEAYVTLADDAEPHTHRAFQGLLERTSRTALAPWPLVTLYSPELAAFLTKAPEEGALSRRLFVQLLAGPASRQAVDLAVRLCPVASLEYLAGDEAPNRVELVEAWNRRLAQRTESRALPKLDQRLEAIAGKFSLELPIELLTAELRFLASWPALKADYVRALEACLESDQPPIVQAGLTVQQHAPALLELNAGLVARWTAQPEIVEAALRNYAFDAAHDHSLALRKLWDTLPASAAKARYNCLYAMGIHPKQNDAIALAAVEAAAYDLIDVAMPVLEAGDPMKAAAAIRHVLTRTERGHEEALRLARSMKLAMFADEALAIAGDTKRDQVVRQAAFLYLQLAAGNVRRELLPLLSTKNADIRLSAIQMFAEPAGLTAADKDEIGPLLIRVAQDDPSPGHRQEAIFALARWQEKLAEPFFRQLLEDNPAVTIIDGHYNDERYWHYRMRLVALLGLAKLNDADAERELLELHEAGGPTERMDVLLVFMELGRAPKEAEADLAAEEPKLVATAARLIAEYGTPQQKKNMQALFRSEPLWQAFRHSGADDHNILSAVGLNKEESP